MFETARNPCICNHAIFRALAYLEPKASSKPCWHVRWSCIFGVLAWSERFSQFSKIFRHIQGYWCIFSHTGAQLGAALPWREPSIGGGLLPCPFWKSKKCPDFEKKDPDCVHLWVKLSIQNLDVRVSRRKNSQNFTLRGLYSCVFDKMFIEVP